MGISHRVLARIMGWWARHGGVAQFHHPTGAVGHLAGWIMGRRSSNLARHRWAVQLLEAQPTDRVIELGCGPGVAIAALASRALRGLVVGVGHSQVMIGQARRRNRAAIQAGGGRLSPTPVERLSSSDGPFMPRLPSTPSACGPTQPPGYANSPGCCGPAGGTRWGSPPPVLGGG